ncbi:hypothetical protein METBIDRAFT_143596 [Metschnikowia bicuspidata var. bicuspidata NRRL YB-4993]|uniref:Uncharacterized protein n=1 Tax=Metschnikowia bicuspidata var. bicuspidata NRRL YB-4993 TaxID=869754 RepID=A0A1A0HDH4_9ASCO|nr:hypothetical protein METBIDRAFT_143596 [Metschnikowia bicuspidata var. bicuspidata NRRL YB-4993]OBA21978.1 hypothetical protein METBIDRAFT_143596 [Metschnikowia bicuspidata var. bicuspidata NRRL YB-4993]
MRRWIWARYRARRLWLGFRSRAPSHSIQTNMSCMVARGGRRTAVSGKSGDGPKGPSAVEKTGASYELHIRRALRFLALAVFSNSAFSTRPWFQDWRAGSSPAKWLRRCRPSEGSLISV